MSDRDDDRYDHRRAHRGRPPRRYLPVAGAVAALAAAGVIAKVGVDGFGAGGPTSLTAQSVQATGGAVGSGGPGASGMGSAGMGSAGAGSSGAGSSGLRSGGTGAAAVAGSAGATAVAGPGGATAVAGPGGQRATGGAGTGMHATAVAVPAGSKVQDVLRATGTLTYQCTGGRYTLSRTSMKLSIENGGPAGTQTSLLSWRFKNGVQVDGALVAEASADPTTLSEALFRVVAVHGGNANDKATTYILRKPDSGGVPPDTCTTTGSRVSVPFRTHYTFYTSPAG